MRGKETGYIQHSVDKNETKEMYGDSCRMKSLGKTPHGGAEGGLAAPAESEVHFRSDIFTQNFGHNRIYMFEARIKFFLSYQKAGRKLKRRREQEVLGLG